MTCRTKVVIVILIKLIEQVNEMNLKIYLNLLKRLVRIFLLFLFVIVYFHVSTCMGLYSCLTRTSSLSLPIPEITEWTDTTDVMFGGFRHGDENNRTWYPCFCPSKQETFSHNKEHKTRVYTSIRLVRSAYQEPFHKIRTK